MDVAQYIADLLLEHDEVGVPSFGTFFNTKVSASFDKRSNSFLPPGKRTAYKPDESDSKLLTDYISRVKNISEPSAKYFAEKFGETIKSQVDLQGKAAAAPLGLFEKREEKLIFLPSDEATVATFYGLTPVGEFAATPRRKIETISPGDALQHAKIVEENVTSPTSIGTLQTSELPDRNKFDEIGGEVEIKRAPRKAWPIILVVVTALTAVGIVGYLSYPKAFDFLLKPNTNKSSVSKEVIPIGRPENLTDSLALADSIMENDSIMRGLQEQGLEVKKAPDTLTNITTETKTIPAPDLITYEIIGASLPSRKEAEQYIKTMKSKGIDARIVEEKKGRLIKVSLGSFTDKEKADIELKRIQKDITKQAWPLQIKNKGSEIKAN